MPHEGSLDFKLVKRICHLQQALDQAMDSLADLRSRVQSQQFVESQLAKTENFANAQQKAIALLQHQLTQKHHWQTRMLHEFAATLDKILERQYRSLTRLKILLQQSEFDIQTYLMQLHHDARQTTHPANQPRIDLEAEIYAARMLTVNLGTQLKGICQSVQDIEGTVTQHQLCLTRMEASLQPLAPETATLPTPGILEQIGPTAVVSHGMLNAPADVASSADVALDIGAQTKLADPEFADPEFADPEFADSEFVDPEFADPELVDPELADPDRHALEASPQTMLFELFHEVKTTQLKVDLLETELTDQLRQQSHLRHRCQILAAERDYYKQQVLDLQQQLKTSQKSWSPPSFNG